MTDDTTIEEQVEYLKNMIAQYERNPGSNEAQADLKGACETIVSEIFDYHGAIAPAVELPW